MIINKQYLQAFSPLPRNYDLTEIMLYVPVAEEIWLKPLLGDAFLEELEHQVKNNEVSEVNSTLFTDGKLYQYLSFATCLEGLPFIWSNFSEAGITVADTEHSKSITLKDITYIEQHLRRQVEYLKDSVLKWLCERQEHYPLFNSCNCPCEKSCCGDGAQLNRPNPYFSVYTTPRINTNLK